ncbi:TPA: hypothetical protein ACJIWU_002959, partial [Enterobacter chengduensis]
SHDRDLTGERYRNIKTGKVLINAQKQKPSHRLGSLNSGARTRNGFCFVIALIRMVFILFHKR